MIKAVYPNASSLKKVFQVLVKLSDEIAFFATPSGLDIRVLTPDKTMLAVVTIPGTDFDEFSIEEEEVSFLVSSTEFKKVFKRATRNDSVVLTINKETSELVITLRDRKTGVEREFGVPLIPKPAEPIPEPQVDLSVSFVMLSSDFKDIVGDLKIIGEEAIFAYEADTITIRSSEAQKDYMCTLREGAPLIMLTSMVEKAKASYSIDMLVAAARAHGVSKNVTISFDTGKPLKVEYTLGGGKVVFWIAPRA